MYLCVSVGVVRVYERVFGRWQGRRAQDTGRARAHIHTRDCAKGEGCQLYSEKLAALTDSPEKTGCKHAPHERACSLHARARVRMRLACVHTKRAHARGQLSFAGGAITLKGRARVWRVR